MTIVGLIDSRQLASRLAWRKVFPSAMDAVTTSVPTPPTMTEADKEAAGGYIERRHRSQRLWTQLLLQRSSVKGQENRQTLMHVEGEVMWFQDVLQPGRKGLCMQSMVEPRKYVLAAWEEDLIRRATLMP